MQIINGATLNSQLINSLLTLAGAAVLGLAVVMAVMGYWLRRLNNQNQILTDRIAQRNETISNQMTEINGQSRLIQEIRNEKSIVETQLKLITEQRDKLDNENKAYRLDLRTQKDTHRDEMDRLYGRIGSIENSFEQRIAEQQKNHDAQINALNQKNLELQNKSDDLQKQFNRLATEHKAIKQERDTLQNTNTSQSNTIAKLRKEVSALEQSGKDKDVQINQLMTALEQALKSNKELQKALDGIIDNITRRERKADDLLKELEVRVNAVGNVETSE